MNINFKELICSTCISKNETVSIDVTADVADSIYQNSTNIDDYALAVKIYKSSGPIEIDNREALSIINNVTGFPIWIQVALRNKISEEMSRLDDIIAQQKVTISESPSPDGGVWAGEGGAIPMEDNVEFVEFVDDAPTPVKSKKKKNNKKS